MNEVEGGMLDDRWPEPMQSWYTIELNGESWRLEGVSVGVSLLDALKQHGQIDSLARADDEQGGPLVIMLGGDQERRPVFPAIDCGLAPLVTMAGRKIWTIRGLKKAFPDHPLWEIEKRYRSIEIHPLRRDNLLALLFEWCGVHAEQKKSSLFEGFISRTADYAGVQKMIKEVMKAKYNLTGQVGDRVDELEEVQYVDEQKQRFYRPQTIVELFELKRQAVASSVIGGALTRQQREEGEMPQVAVILSTEGIGELRAVVDEGSHWEIGSAVPLSEVVAGIGSEYPGLVKILKRFESVSIRNRATLGGQLNLCRGRAELGTILLALDARVQLASAEGSRNVTLDSFIGKQAGTTLRPNEIIKSVTLPKSTAEMLQAKGCKFRLCDAYKVALRRSLSPASITAAFAIELDGEEQITQAVLVYGGLGSRPVIATRTALELKGKAWNEKTVLGALKQLDEEVASLSGMDKESSARQWLAMLFQKFYHQHPQASDLNPRRLGVIEKRLLERSSAE